MKTSSVLFAAISMCFFSTSCFGQFDFGRMLENQAQQVVRDLERDIVRQIQPPPQVRPPGNPPIPGRPCPSPGPSCPPVNIQPSPIVPTPPIGSTDSPASVTTRPAETPEAELPQIEVGHIATIRGTGYSDQHGGVFLKVESMILETQLISWVDTQAEAQLPTLPIIEPTAASVFVITSDECVVNKVDVLLMPAVKSSSMNSSSSITSRAAVGEVADIVPFGESNTVATGSGPALPLLHSGQAWTFERQLSEEPGSMELQFGERKLPVTITHWSARAVTAVMPEIEIHGVQHSELVIRNGDGQITNRIAVQLTSGN